MNKVKYDIKSKPTMYNGIQFRSMLEAKWAAFFDLVGWKYQYEPFEMNGKVPDFIIYCSSEYYKGINIIVEVKPNHLITIDFLESLYDTYYKTPYHILILDENPFYVTERQGYVYMGKSLQNCGAEYLQSDFENINMKSVDEIGSSYMMFDGMIKGEIERKTFIFENELEHKELKKLWKEAQNIIQFKSY